MTQSDRHEVTWSVTFSLKPQEDTPQKREEVLSKMNEIFGRILNAWVKKRRLLIIEIDDERVSMMNFRLVQIAGYFLRKLKRRRKEE